MGPPPLLLLDDVLSELDLEKQVHLLEYLKGLATQILITTTDLTTILQFDPQLGEVFNLGQGREKEDLPEMGEGIRV